MSDGPGAVPPTLASALADRYRLERELGRGGMATVYLAHDLKLGRPVAIKVLREDLGALVGSTLGIERFNDEIRTTAKLQHAHILSLLDSGEARGQLFYVMPYVDGESLRARLDRESQLPIPEAVRIAGQVADALAHAHAHGIIHRDVKPENILLQGARTLVADFGIALATGNHGEVRRTAAGLTLGTPLYQSPEQAAGARAIDARTDIYSLGAVLYEMLTGRPPFTGATEGAIQDKLLLERPVPPTHIRPAIPASVEDAVLCALERNPADRFSRMDEFRHALSASLIDVAARRPTPRPIPVPPPSRLWIGVATASVIVALAAVAWRSFAAPARGPATWDVALPDSAPILYTPRIDGARVLDVASDASFAVYIAKRGVGREIWWRSLLTDEARPIPGTSGAIVLTLSPSDDAIAFVADSALRVVGLDGGPSREVTDAGDPASIDWLTPDSILVTFGLRWISPTRGWIGEPRPGGCWTPSRAPGGRFLCSRGDFLGIDSPDGDRSLAIATRDGPSDAVGRRVRGTNPIPLDDQRFVFLTREGDLMATAFQGDSIVSDPVPVAHGISTDELWGGGQLVLVDNGTLVYAPGRNIGLGRPVATRGDGIITPLLETPEYYQEFTPSPDGRSLATNLRSADGEVIAVFDLATARRTDWMRTSLTLEGPVWTPDGDLVTSIRHRAGGASHFTNVRGRPLANRRLDTLDIPANAWIEATVGRDSMLALLPGVNRSLAHVHRSGNAWRVDTILRAFAGFAPTVSPDRRSVAYTDIHDGRWEVFVTSFPDGEHTVKVSNTGGMDALWLSNDELAYFDDYTFYRARLGPGPERTVARPRAWFRDELFLDTGGRSAVRLNDGRIVYLRRLVPETGTHLKVIPSFAQIARRALAAQRRR